MIFNLIYGLSSLRVPLFPVSSSFGLYKVRFDVEHEAKSRFEEPGIGDPATMPG
jgi:hypothetical protein